MNVGRLWELNVKSMITKCDKYEKAKSWKQHICN